VCIGILRGLAETRTPLVVNVIGFWILGIPTALLFAFELGVGPVGLWWGLVVGLGAVSLILLARVRTRLRGPISRAKIGEAAPSAGAE
jgi:MATE family multidrug resistance protein